MDNLCGEGCSKSNDASSIYSGMIQNIFYPAMASHTRICWVSDTFHIIFWIFESRFLARKI